MTLQMQTAMMNSQREYSGPDSPSKVMKTLARHHVTVTVRECRVALRARNRDREERTSSTERTSSAERITEIPMPTWKDAR